MENPERYRMSKERLDTLKEELNYLETVRAKEVADQIAEARSFGDLSENSEYDEAKNEQAKVYARIAEVKDLIENAEIIEANEDNLPKDAVTLGSLVKVVDLEAEEELEFEIVGSQEANPAEGRISDDSLLGAGMKGHKAGEIIVIDAPAGKLKFEIKSVRN